MTVHVAWAAVMSDIGAVTKSDRNTHQNFDFRGIDAVVNAASPAFRQVGIVVVPDLRSVDYETVEVGNKRSIMQSCKVVVAYTFHGPAGDTITASAPGEAMDSGDKATPKAMSVAFRTALLQALCIPTTETDPDENSYERSARQESKSPARAKKELVEYLTGRVPDPVKDHAVAVWTEARGESTSAPLSEADTEALIATAEAYIADLEAMA